MDECHLCKVWAGQRSVHLLYSISLTVSPPHRLRAAWTNGAIATEAAGKCISESLERPTDLLLSCRRKPACRKWLRTSRRLLLPRRSYQRETLRQQSIRRHWSGLTHRLDFYKPHQSKKTILHLTLSEAYRRRSQCPQSRRNQILELVGVCLKRW